jgi:ADP-ribose pyrophosphatase YjhB (NUDIX family)
MTHSSPRLLEFPEKSLHNDYYSGVAVHVKEFDSDLAKNPTMYSRVLESSLQLWKMEQRRGIWIHIPKSHGHLIAPSLEAGFDFHYCGDGELILKRWLPDTPSRLPLGPTHQVGVGALILNDEGNMLVVREKSGPAAAHELWKMPTGLLDPSEDVGDAAVRELKEETGLDGTLERILSIRQAHTEGRASDLFFICKLRLDDPHQTPKLQEEEIVALKWMSPTEYANQELWSQSPVYQELNASILRAAQHDSAGMVQVTLPVGFRPGTNTLFMSAHDQT